MAEPKTAATETEISRERLAELLNEDLSREYQAIISYVVYSQVLKGAEYMDIANQLEIHAKQELDHALTISRQIDYLGKMPSVTPKPLGHRKKRRTCCVLISKMKMKRYEIIAIVSASAKRLANLRWPSRFVRF
jgi:bacterioferritin (cytochrome b1)